MAPYERPDGRVCPVCETELPPQPNLRRCPRCGARALAWVAERPLEQPVVLFNARIAGIMAGVFVAMLALLVLGYRFPIPWGVALIAMALPVAGYVIFGAAARKLPPSWRTQYMVGVLALNAGLLVAAIAGLAGVTHPMSLIGIVALVAALSWRGIRHAVTQSTRPEAS